MSNPTEAHGGFTPNESLNTSTYLPRLLPTTIDAIAQSDPDRVFAEFLEAPHHSGETYELTFGVFARIIDRLSWWMSEICSQIGLKHFDTIAFAGFLDLRHYGMLVAAIKCGYKVKTHFDLLSCINTKRWAFRSSSAPWSTMLLPWPDYSRTQMPRSFSLQKRSLLTCQRYTLCQPY